MFDLRYDPSVIEIPVPRYYREDDRIAVDLAFKERVVRETDGKKKKVAKKKKKSKKKGDEEEVKKEPPMPMPVKNSLMSKLLIEHSKNHNDDPEIEKMMDPMILDIDIIPAIMIIQKTDRGR